MVKLKTVYFDLGNVLLFFSHEKMINQMTACTGLDTSELRYLLIECRYREMHESGKIDTVQLYQIVQKHSPRPFTFPAFTEALSNIFTPNTALWPVVEQLKQQGIRLIVLSNICECHFSRVITHYPIFQLFDHKILSFEVGACKPHPLIFQTALSAAQCDPEECFYTDDIPEFIAGARSVGLPGEIFTDVSALRQHLAARNIVLA